ncbi:MAG: hypothetical protein LC768_12140 [Acidobacteria bacterium]|nr:hypothetical protein [Acidobacteriota bacterium]
MKEEFFDIVRKLDEQICRDERLDRELFAQLFDKERELGLLHDERPYCPFLRPHFITRSQYEKVARATEVLSGAFELLAAAALSLFRPLKNFSRSTNIGDPRRINGFSNRSRRLTAKPAETRKSRISPLLTGTAFQR